LKAKVVGGRPPVEAASPVGQIRPELISRSTWEAIVDLDCPVDNARSARVRG